MSLKLEMLMRKFVNNCWFILGPRFPLFIENLDVSEKGIDLISEPRSVQAEWKSLQGLHHVQSVPYPSRKPTLFTEPDK